MFLDHLKIKKMTKSDDSAFRYNKCSKGIDSNAYGITRTVKPLSSKVHFAITSFKDFGDLANERLFVLFRLNNKKIIMFNIQTQVTYVKNIEL